MLYKIRPNNLNKLTRKTNFSCLQSQFFPESLLHYKGYYVCQSTQQKLWLVNTFNCYYALHTYAKETKINHGKLVTLKLQA